MRRFLSGRGFTRSSGTRRRSITRREDIYFKTNCLLVICLMKLYNKKSVYSLTMGRMAEGGEDMNYLYKNYGFFIHAE